MDIPEGAAICPICRYEFPGRAVLPCKPVAALLLVIILGSLVLALRRWFGR